VFIFSDIVRIFQHNVQKILLSWHIAFIVAVMYNKKFLALN